MDSKMSEISKSKAKEIGQKWYFTGIPCKNNHIDKRYVNTSVCYECKRQKNRENRIKYPEKAKKRSKQSYLKRKKLGKIKNDWAKNNPERVKEIKRNYKIRNKEKVKAQNREYQRKKRKNPLYRANRAVSRQIWGFLKNKKSGRKWESIVGYSFEDLKQHIESKFTPEMNWDNYGSFWEIDHIKPISKFEKNNNNDSDEQIKNIWSLSNLQPLECSLNRSKQNNNCKRRIELKIDFLNEQLRTENSDYESISRRLQDVDLIRLLHASMGMVTESSEFQDMLKKVIFYGKDVDKTNLIEEMGDILYYIAMACNTLEIDIESVMQTNIDKLKTRYPDKFTEENAVNRDLSKEREILENSEE